MSTSDQQASKFFGGRQLTSKIFEANGSVKVVLPLTVESDAISARDIITTATARRVRRHIDRIIHTRHIHHFSRSVASNGGDSGRELGEE